ncbi:hypothetical protein TWF788_009154 [Orbilia oligospora]|uniref:Dynamin N-terminal domain-containing protein n=1 Tax=Orbilia oligospora TaxID=2813651 RepID=A0A7C8PQH6_ORBOL|nr:hypothetical protein TWF788_009154 [Orbilia oligospora]
MQKNGLLDVQGENILKRVQIAERADFSATAVLAFVGDSGVGKSKLLTAVLGEPNILPTSGLHACTSFPIEIRQIEGGKKGYRVETEFLQQSELESEMRAVIHDMGGADSNVSLNKPSTTDAQKIALAKIKALFPGVSNFADIPQRVDELYKSHQDLESGTYNLETDSRVEVVEYMRSLVPFTAREEEETILWPLVKVVKLYLDSEALKTGAILVDLPGLRDSNAARTAVTRQYMTQANEIVVVTRLTRAVTDETTGELSREGYIKRLKHDGRRHLTIVCTCSDHFEPSDAAGDFKDDKEFRKKYHLLNNEIEARYLSLDSERPKHQNVIKEEILALETSLQNLCIEARDKYAVESISKTYSKLLSEDTSIRCFVTSSKHYLGHFSPRKRLGIMNIDQTQIPMLRDYCASAPLEQKSALAAQFVQGIWDIQALARLFASNDGTGMSETGRRKAKTEMNKAFMALSESLNNESLVFATNIQNQVQLFLDSLSPVIIKGEKHCLQLHGTLVKENRFQAVKSAYLNHGESSTGKLKNLNEQFISPLGVEVDTLWEAFITKTEDHLKAWNLRVLQLLEEFEVAWQSCIETNFESSPKGRAASIKLLEEFLIPRIERAQAVATKFCSQLIEDQRPVRRLFLLPDHLTDLLRPGYEKGIAEGKGSGALERMTKVFEDYIRTARVFDILANDIRKEVEAIQGRFEQMCKNWVRTSVEDTQIGINGWLKENEDIGQEEAEHKADIIRIVDKFKKPLMILVEENHSFQRKKADV